MTPSSPVDVLIVENRNVEKENGTMSEMTFTKFFPDDVNEEKTCKEKKRNRINQKISSNYFS